MLVRLVNDSLSSSLQAFASRYLLFSLGGKPCAFRLQDVSGVAMLPALAMLPESPKHVLGFARSPGRAVPVLDLATVLGEAPARITAESAMIYPIGSQIAWLVDAVHGLVDTICLRGATEVTWNGACIGTLPEAGDAVLLDAARVLAEEERFRLEAWTRRFDERLALWPEPLEAS